jgi:hypothetical protein
LGVIVFVAGTPRYVASPPRGELFTKDHKKRDTGESISLFTIFRICLLIVPFCVGYNQMPTTFILQGSVMTKAFGFIDVASMNSLDAISVLVFGYLTASHIYPALAKRGIKLATTHKFAIGSSLGALAMVWALIVEQMIHRAYHKDGRQICVLWQAPAYVLIGWGEIFAVSAAYEMAFTASPPDKKALASATNIFCVGGLPNLLCIFLYQSCSRWFMNDRGDTNIQHIQDYATAHVGNYFLVLLSVMLFGIVLNALPGVRDFVASIEEKAADLVKTPVLRKGSPPKKGYSVDEESPLLVLTPRTKRYRQYLKHARGPVLLKAGSMRAGPSLSQSSNVLPGANKAKKIKYKYIPTLYQTKLKVAVGPDGEPVKAGNSRLGKEKRTHGLGRLNST